MLVRHYTGFKICGE